MAECIYFKHLNSTYFSSVKVYLLPRNRNFLNRKWITSSQEHLSKWAAYLWRRISFNQVAIEPQPCEELWRLRTFWDVKEAELWEDGEETWDDETPWVELSSVWLDWLIKINRQVSIFLLRKVFCNKNWSIQLQNSMLSKLKLITERLEQSKAG